MPLVADIERASRPEGRAHRIKTLARLALPPILAELTATVMQYIDSAMVGSLGAEASASIGLVSTSTWLIGGMCISAAAGFSVQTAQYIGAGREGDARHVFRQALLFCLAFGMLIAAGSAAVSPFLPSWLGGRPEILGTASTYFLIWACALPFVQFRQLCGSMLQCSGDMKTPAVLNTMLCVSNVVFNFFLIYPTREIWGLTVPGAGMGVAGAALGTAIGETMISVLMIWFAAFRSRSLSLSRDGGGWKPDMPLIGRAMRISWPTAVEHIVVCGAYVCGTLIVSPLGTVPVAANSLAVTAESFCYMPGYGIGSASTTLVGQSLGAAKSGDPEKARSAARRYADTGVIMGMAVMAVAGAILYFAAPAIFAMLTPDERVRELGVAVLRIEAFAEPFYGASIVCSGAMRGAGDTLIPSIMNLASMWGVRIPLGFILVPRIGLQGYWIAMATELGFRGVIFLIRMIRGGWLKKGVRI
ncbi:MAG: MATE family efflux transporter [Clostridiales bacterium]|nr:MATE family efflux transporter [Clostridiales bacterium]